MIFFDSLALRTSPWTGQCFLQRWGATPWASTLPRGSRCCPPAAQCPAHGPAPGQHAAPAICVCFPTLWPTSTPERMALWDTTAYWKTGFLELLAWCYLETQNREGRMRLKDFAALSTPKFSISELIPKETLPALSVRAASPVLLHTCSVLSLALAQLWGAKHQPGLQVLTTPIYIHATSSSQVIDWTVVSVDFIAAQSLKEELVGAIKSSNACLADTMHTAQQLPTSAYSQDQCFDICLILHSLNKVNLS